MRSVLLFTVASLGLAINQVPKQEFNRARALYYQGADGDKKAYDKASELFSKLRTECPNDAHVEAYYGSLRLLAASRTWAVWTKNSLSKEGIQLMDAAVKTAPENLDIRFVRAATTYSLPSFFRRKEQSRQDFDFLAGRAITAAHDGTLEPRLAAASLYFHGEFLRDGSKTGEAIAAWKQAIQLAPQSRAARDSSAELRKLGASID